MIQDPTLQIPAPSSARLDDVAHFANTNQHRHAVDVQDAIMGYVPHLPAHQWDAARPFVLGTVLRVEFATAKYVREVMLPLVRLAVWALEVAGLPLRTETLLRASVIQRFAASQPTALKRREYERRLLLVSEALGGERQARRLGTPQAMTVKPLAREDIAAMSTFVTSLREPAQRRLGFAIMGGCGGAGLRRHELLDVVVDDVETVGSGFVLHVREGFPRSVVVLREYEEYIRRALKGAASGESLSRPGPMKRVRREDNARPFGTRPGGRVPDAARLRSTWIAGMCPVLTAGELLYVAGYKNLSSLDPYAEYFTIPDPAELAEVLRDPKTVGGAA